MTDHTDHELVLLTSTPTEMGASIIIAALEDNGIEASMTGNFTAGVLAEVMGWVQVLVPEAELTRAQQVMNEVKQDRADIDWSQVDVGQPESDE
jgi:hypothetical protein